MANYLNHVEPRIDELDWQITHNDPSPFNIFQTDGGIAFIDFGDGGWNPRIQDLVIAASHFVTDPGQPLGGAEPIIAGHHAVRPLTALEMHLLVDMIRARQAALILINHWRAALFPDEAEYIMKNVKRAETGLLILSVLDEDADERAVRAAISSSC
jgi:Ser/Thr protein kinase RdoA (MazF antagonist)